jgi:DNA-binding NtrC family response regulator
VNRSAEASVCSDAANDEVLLGESAVMCRLRAEIAAVAPLPSTVLVTGERGGEGLVARLSTATPSGAESPSSTWTARRSRRL